MTDRMIDGQNDRSKIKGRSSGDAVETERSQLKARLRLNIKRTPRRLVVASSSTCFGFKFGFEFEFKFGFESRLQFGFYKIC